MIKVVKVSGFQEGSVAEGDWLQGRVRKRKFVLICVSCTVSDLCKSYISLEILPEQLLAML